MTDIPKKSNRLLILLTIVAVLCVAAAVVMHQRSSQPTQAKTQVQKRQYDGKRNIGVAFLYNVVVNGGLPRVMQILSTELAKRDGYDVYLLTNNGNEHEFDIGDGVTRETAFEENGAFSHEKVREIVNRRNIDVVVYNRNDPYDIDFLKSLGVKVVSICHEFLLCQLYYTTQSGVANDILCRCLTRYLSDVACCLVPTDIPLWNMCGVKNIIFLPNPLTFDPEKVVPSKLDNKTVVMIGRSDRVKRCEVGIYAMSKVVKSVPDAKLQIIGGDKNHYFADLRLLVSALGLENNVEFCGYQTDVGKFYQNASVFILTSNFETFPMALSEAKAYGLPNVVTGMEFLEMGKEGTIHVGPDDVDALANEMIKLLTDEKYRKENGRLARESLKRLSTDKTIDKWEEIIHALVDSDGGKINDIISKCQVADSDAADEMYRKELALAVKRNPEFDGKLDMEKIFNWVSDVIKQFEHGATLAPRNGN